MSWLNSTTCAVRCTWIKVITGRHSPIFRQAIASILPDSVPEGPVIREENPYFATLISAYFNTGDAYVKWYGEDHDSEHLEHALEYYRAAYGQMIIARQNIGDDLSKTFLMSNFQEVLNAAFSAHACCITRQAKRDTSKMRFIC